MFGWVQLLLIVKRRIKKGRERGRREEAAREVTIKIRGHSCFVAEVGTRRFKGMKRQENEEKEAEEAEERMKAKEEKEEKKESEEEEEEGEGGGEREREE